MEDLLEENRSHEFSAQLQIYEDHIQLTFFQETKQPNTQTKTQTEILAKQYSLTTDLMAGLHAVAVLYT